MEKILQFLLLFSICILHINGDDSDYCYAKDNTPYKSFSEWTSYDDVKGPTVIEQGCTPIYVWALVKHGVKSLTDQQLERSKKIDQFKKDIDQNNKDKRCALCSEDSQNINSWNNVLDKKQDEDLAKKAFNNHEVYATYMKNFIDSTQKPTKENFDFKASKVKGASDSAIKFTNKLLETSFDKADGNSIEENDSMLKSKDTCAKWLPNYQEMDAFESTPIFKAMSFRIASRLGYQEQLSFESIWAMYESCFIGFTLTASNRPAFCAAFLPEDLKILEYKQDLRHYYASGHGNALSDKMGCPLVKDLADKLSKVSAGTLTGKKGAVYFGDDENVMGVLTKLGLYRDDTALKHDNYQAQKGTRKWRSSLLSPYTATIHAVVFSCANNEKKVEFYHNQNIVKLEGCKSTTGNKCPLGTFLTEVKKSIPDDKCDEDFCGSYPTPSGGNMVGFSFIVMVVCLFFSRFGYVHW